MTQEEAIDKVRTLKLAKYLNPFPRVCILTKEWRY